LFIRTNSMETSDRTQQRSRCNYLCEKY